MQPPIDETERLLRDALARLWPSLHIEIESLGYLVVLSVRPPGVPREQAPELRLSWVRGEGHVVGTIHQTPSSGGRTIRVEVPPTVVAEAGIRELRSLIGLGMRE